MKQSCVQFPGSVRSSRAGRGHFWALGLALGLVALTGCGDGCARKAPSASPKGAPPDIDAELHKALAMRPGHAKNRLAYIPPQCFTRVSDGPSQTPQNPCYVCHADAPAPNQQSQPELQLAYDFPEPRAGHDAENPWHNLFRDRRADIASISDEAVLAYVAQDNYGAGARDNLLASRLRAVPREWDANDNGRWDGYLPDAFFSFDAEGFDRGPDGQLSGFFAFDYYPLPGAFMPTNGSFDDVLIRLPKPFRQSAEGASDLLIYRTNLAIVEALIKQADVGIEPTDEAVLGVDLDGDGALGRANRVAFRFEPAKPSRMRFVGEAGALQAQGKLQVAPGLFPLGTEFLHSVRYLALDEAGRPRAAPRMKELRYARKHHYRTYAQAEDHAQREAKEADLNPDRPEQFLGDAERGLSNALGWVYQGFIEDARGELRPQNYEETLFCMGCHTGLSTTDDGIFSFSRKLGAGTFHGGYGTKLESALPDPLRRDGLPEFATYLRNNRAGDEYRANDEVQKKFFGADGRERPEAFAALSEDVRILLLPSRGRALSLDKAYWLTVREQAFDTGRDALLGPAENVLRSVKAGTPTGVDAPLSAPRLALDDQRARMRAVATRARPRAHATQ